MGVQLATKTLLAIEEAVHADQGAAFRGWLGKVIPHVGDAYNTEEFPFRSHLGASGIGDNCPRVPWYGFRWATRTKHGGRLLRLFNRGHLEEARFIAMLLTIGVQVYQQDEHGNQFRISDAEGHFGGSGDGILYNVPDLKPGQQCLAEFKTASEKKFKAFVAKGVQEANFTYYIQMQVYMRKMGIPVALFMVVNKNDDSLYGELVFLDGEVADQYIDRGVALVWLEQPPSRISNSPGWFECKWCDHRPICHLKQAPDVNCRTCNYSKPDVGGVWKCSNFEADSFGPLTKQAQLDACPKYRRKF